MLLKDIHCYKGIVYHELTNPRLKNDNIGKISIHSEEVSKKTEKVLLDIGLKDITEGDIFLLINKICENNVNDACYRSEVQHCRNGNIKFDEINISGQKLCNCDYYRPLIFEIYAWGKNGSHSLLGSLKVSINTFKRRTEFPLNYNNEKVGKMIINKYEIIETSSFLSYIKEGCEMNFMVGIDFTSSNGDPESEDSLHYISDSDNQYESAIKIVGNVLEQYDTDKLFPSYGFGCLYKGKLTHCFPINENFNDPEIKNVSGILKAYHKIIKKIRLYGPTYFRELLKTAINIAESYECTEEQKYLVLLILTDGCIHDMNDTKDLIVKISFFNKLIFINYN